jgi:hypothetical protein
LLLKGVAMLGNAVREKAGGLSEAFEHIANGAGEGMEDLIEVVGGSIQSLCDNGINLLNENSTKKSNSFFDWISATISNFTNFLATVFYSVFRLLGITLSGCIRLFFGFLIFDKSLTRDGLERILFGIASTTMILLLEILFLIGELIPGRGMRTDA